ncbi:hypothetical protein ACPZ19_17515, partial [Amycolatopsis lurida]
GGGGGPHPAPSRKPCTPRPLGRIDEIVPPGMDLGPVDVAYEPPSLARANRRRTVASVQDRLDASF